jgi:hypothetical protein
VGHTLRYIGLLHMKANRDRVTQFASKLTEVRRRMMHTAPSGMLRRDEAENGRIDVMNYVGLCYPYFIIFIVLDPMNIVVL